MSSTPRRRSRAARDAGAGAGSIASLAVADRKQHRRRAGATGGRENGTGRVRPPIHPSGPPRPSGLRQAAKDPQAPPRRPARPHAGPVPRALWSQARLSHGGAEHPAAPGGGGRDGLRAAEVAGARWPEGGRTGREAGARTATLPRDRVCCGEPLSGTGLLAPGIVERSSRGWSKAGRLLADPISARVFVSPRSEL
jgi:hypothetical protein